MKITLDALRLNDKNEAHKYLKEAMNFPEYYGENLDALHDCLTELDGTEIEFLNREKLSGGYFDRVFQVFLDSSEENDNLRIL